jgi:transcriptional regulator NrdR family protein
LRVKRTNGPVEVYSRPRLFAEVYGAFSDLKAKPETIDSVIDNIESKLLDLKQDIIETSQITSIVLSTLKHHSTPAFLRYLSSHTELNSSAELKRQLKKYQS